MKVNIGDVILFIINIAVIFLIAYVLLDDFLNVSIAVIATALGLVLFALNKIGKDVEEIKERTEGQYFD